MNTETEIKHLAHRKNFLAQVVADPKDFKICEQCESLNRQQVRVCIFCHAYRFIEETQEVLRCANEMCSRPFRREVGAIPRLS